MAETASWVAHTYQALGRMKAVLASLEAISAAQRGFVLTGQEEFLAPVAAARESLTNDLAELRRLLADDAEQTHRLNSLESAIERRLTHAAETERLRRERGGPAASAFVAVGEGERLMTEIRARMQEMEHAEEQLLARRRADASASQRESLIALAVAAAFGIGVVVVLLVLLHRSNARLESRVADRTAALARSEALYRGLVEHATYGIYRSSPDGRFLSVNPALVELLGYSSAQELMERNLADDVCIRPDDRAVMMEKILRSGRVSDFETEWKRKDGRRVTVRLAAWPVRDAQGNIEAVEAIVQDVTEQRLLEAQLRQAQKMEALGQLTGGIAHDFNNVLTVILGNAELIAAGLPPDSGLREDLAQLTDAARRGATMVARLLQFSRRSPLSVKATHLGSVVTDFGRVLPRLLPETIELHVTDLTDKSAVVLADPGAVEQMIMNLCTNARDAMPEGGSIHIRCETAWLDEGYRATHPWIVPGAYVCVSVTDTGTGMDQETMRKVFEPFFTTKPPGQGTGLGLAMVYGLMKQHNGMAHIYSEPGRGTTVKLYFPATSDAVAAAESRGASDSRQLAGGTGTILLAEDDAGVRRAARRALEGQGYSVLVAQDGEEALELYRANRRTIGLVISDLVMPKLGGRQLAEALR
ncbi:MAG TPA: CHASE3 domain-containing protein, partial [Gemmatimonadales bacterium]|nr:CHASE3 domain-containing protein [Gemmatimonadales bacterium]